MKRKITIDLRSSGLLGPTCKFFEFLMDLKIRGYSVRLIDKKWDNGFDNGVTYDSVKKKYIKGESKYLWDPAIHPNDLFKNLILPTFDNIEYISPKNNFHSRFLAKYIPPYLFPRRLIDIDFVSLSMEQAELVKYHQQFLDNLFKNGKIKHYISYFLFITYFKVFRKFKIVPLSRGFSYKLSNKKMTRDVADFISQNKKEGVKYILISVLWDESMKFEKQADRLKGGPDFSELEFSKLKKYIQELDEFALTTGKIKFVLASKKAVDWENFLRSDFVDLRNFEELGFSLSQSIYLAQEICDVSLNWPSTYSIWITNCSKMIHLTWMDNKDTAVWARNKIHEKSPKYLLSILGIE